MPRKYAESYIAGLIAGNEYGNLFDLSSAICSCPSFAPSKPDYGLPTPAFVYVESLLWFAQAIRSGVWTYYEATTLERQSVMNAALQEFAPDDFALHYAHGMRDWQDETKIDAVDN
jgi:hypothetical protein